MKKRKDNSFRSILGQYYLDSHSNTNILKITGLVKYCPIIYQAECGAFSVYRHYYSEVFTRLKEEG